MTSRPEPRIVALTSGFVLGILYSAPEFLGSNVGTFCTYLTLLILLLIGLSSGIKVLVPAAIIASPIIMILSGPMDGIFFLVLIVVPVGYFVRGALLWKGDETTPSWYPVLRVLAEMTVIVIVLFLLADFLTAWTQEGGLRSVLTHEFSEHASISDNPDVTKILHSLAKNWGFLLLASMGWSWVLTIYAFAVIANTILVNHARALRPNLRLSASGALPVWLLVFSGIAALAAVLGSPEEQFTAKTLFLLLMLPYFLAGCAKLHHSVAQLPLKLVVLVVFYALLMLMWPITILVIGSGFYTQLVEILDRRHKMR